MVTTPLVQHFFWPNKKQFRPGEKFLGCTTSSNFNLRRRLLGHHMWGFTAIPAVVLLHQIRHKCHNVASDSVQETPAKQFNYLREKEHEEWLWRLVESNLQLRQAPAARPVQDENTKHIKMPNICKTSGNIFLGTTYTSISSIFFITISLNLGPLEGRRHITWP